MTTYYFKSAEEALRQAKTVARERNGYFGGITLRSGRKAFAVYDSNGKVVGQYALP